MKTALLQKKNIKRNYKKLLMIKEMKNYAQRVARK